MSLNTNFRSLLARGTTLLGATALGATGILALGAAPAQATPEASEWVSTSTGCYTGGVESHPNIPSIAWTHYGTDRVHVMSDEFDGKTRAVFSHTGWRSYEDFSQRTIENKVFRNPDSVTVTTSCSGIAGSSRVISNYYR
ncbi:MAG: hypothetical protein Q4C81_09760 [Kocuria sp.]|nr:hypothetical protein [Kocuria sp.]